MVPWNEGVGSRAGRLRGAARPCGALVALAAAALLGCQGSSAARSGGPCGQTYFVGGVVDPGYGYGGGYAGGGAVVWYDPGDDWSPGEPAPPPDDGSYDNGGGYDYCSEYPDDPSCGGSGSGGSDPNAGSDNGGGGDTSGGDPSAGSGNGGDTSGGDTSGGDTSGGDTSGGDDVSLAHRLHLKGGSHPTTGGLRMQGVPAACYACTMMCQLDDGTTARAATGASDTGNTDACNAAVHELELWAHHDYGRKIASCTSVDPSGSAPPSAGSASGGSAAPHVPAAPSVSPPASPSPVPGDAVNVGDGTRDVRGRPTLTR